MDTKEIRRQRNGSRGPSASNRAASREYLAFVLGAEHYAIDILCVQEIRGYAQVTHIANAPEHIKGVLNLRGAIVPILDLRIRFGNASPTYDDHTIVIVLSVLNRVFGVVVDAVSDVMEIAASDLMAAPDLGAAALTTHIVGVASRDERMLIVLDIEGVLAQDDSRQLDRIAAKGTAVRATGPNLPTQSPERTVKAEGATSSDLADDSWEKF